MNKILVAILAATIIGSMAFMQPTEAQAYDCGAPVPHGTLIAINNYNIEDYLCHLTYYAVDPKFKLPLPPICLSCPASTELDHAILEQVIFNEYRTLVVSDKLDMLSDVSSKNSDDVIIIIIIVVAMSGVSITLGAANLLRKR